MFGRRTLPVFVALALGALTVAGVLLGASADRHTADVARQHALETTTQAARALGSSLEARISDVAGLFNSSDSVSAREFANFTDPMLDDSRATSLSYVELVDGASRAVVRYTQTADGNDAGLGVDALSNPVDAEAIAAADRTRSAASTRPELLPGGRDAGVTLYVPVYGPDAGPTAERRPIGFIAATCQFSRLSLVLTSPVEGTQTELRIAGAPEFRLGSVSGPTARSEILVAGRKWQLAVSGPPIATQMLGLTKSQMAAIILGLLTILITAITRQAVVAAQRADELAGLRQAERDQAVHARDTEQAAAQELLAHLPDLAVLRVDADLRVVDASGGLLSRVGWSRDEMEGRIVSGLFGEAGESMVTALREALAGRASSFSSDGIRAVGNRYWMQALPVPGEPGALLVASDVSALMGAESARAEAEGRFERVFDNAPVGMALVSTDGKFVQVNEAMTQITGYERDALLLMGPPNVTHPDDIAVTQRQVRDLIGGDRQGMTTEKRYQHADGHTVWVSLNTTVLHDAAGTPEFILAHVLDITERHEFAEQLQHLANHDPLTDLRNRRSFEEALTTQLAMVRRYQDPAALLVIDLDHFKAVNDTLGHQAGDRVLTGTADTLRLLLRDSDTIGRLGGDEFAVLLPKASPEEAVIVADKLACGLRELGIRLGVQAGVQPVTASIGVTIMRGCQRTVDEVFADADAALYAVKTAGRDGFRVSEPVTRQAA